MLNKLTRIQAGESLPFTFDRSGASLKDWTCQIFVKQKPDDIRAVDRQILSTNNFNFKGVLTSAETLNLEDGVWQLVGLLQNIKTDEQEEIPIRFSVTKSFKITPSVSTPIFSPPAGTFENTVVVTIASATPEAIIHFTTDGSDPTILSDIFKTPIILTPSGSPHSLKAFAVKSGLIDSAISSAIYNVQDKVESVTFLPIAGIISETQTITLSTPTSGAIIHFTDNGDPVDKNSEIFLVPFTLPLGNQIVKAFAVKPNFIDSDKTQANYTVEDMVEPVTYSPPEGTIFDIDTIALSTTTSGATIHFTKNGDPVDDESEIFVLPFTLPLGNQVVKAFALKTGFFESVKNEANYNVIQQTVQPVTFSPPAGTIRETDLITLLTGTSGATIRFTDDGSPPDGNSDPFILPFTLPLGNQIVRAFAEKDGFIPSVETQANYAVEDVVAPVTFLPVDENILDDTPISLATTTSGATIRFTTNGETPDENSQEFILPFTLTEGVRTVKAIGLKDNFFTSTETQKTYTVTTAFSPLDISNIVFWVDANDENSVDESVGGVSEWRDQSSNNNHIIQGVSSRRPSYNDSVTPHFILFNGTTDLMGLNSASQRGQPNTFFMVARAVDNSGTQVIFDSAGTSRAQVFSDSGGVWTMGADVPVSTGKSSNTNKNILTPIFDKFNSRFYVNGGSSNIFNVGTDVTFGFLLATATEIENFANYEFYDILFYSRLLTLQELNDLGEFFADKHSLTWTTITV